MSHQRWSLIWSTHALLRKLSCVIIINFKGLIEFTFFTGTEFAQMPSQCWMVILSWYFFSYSDIKVREKYQLYPILSIFLAEWWYNESSLKNSSKETIVGCWIYINGTWLMIGSLQFGLGVCNQICRSWVRFWSETSPKNADWPKGFFVSGSFIRNLQSEAILQHMKRKINELI